MKAVFHDAGPNRPFMLMVVEDGLDQVLVTIADGVGDEAEQGNCVALTRDDALDLAMSLKVAVATMEARSRALARAEWSIEHEEAMARAMDIEQEMARITLANTIAELEEDK